MSCWKKIVSLCFPTNKRNYARYGSYYVSVLENLETTHPGALEELSEKGISVRRSSNGIGQSIDMAGEQTFMRSAKTIGGIKSFKTNVEAYDRWVFSRLFQAKFVEGMLAMTGFTDDSSTKKYLYSIISDYFINPFSNDLEPTMLFNIASGSPTSSEISKCLLQFF